MDDVIHLVAAVLGALLLFGFFRSIITVALINRQPDDPLLRLASRLTSRLVRSSPDRPLDTRKAHRSLWYWPVSQLALIAVWFVLVVIGFALLYWAVDAVHDFGAALIASGSALSTLGFATPDDTQGQILAIVEGSVGLGIVVFMFTFIPGYLSTVQAREEQVAWVYRRTGPDPTGVLLLDWLLRAGGRERLSSTWNDWESWFRSLGETHALSPILAFDLSIRTGQSWVVASGAMLDAAALAIVATEDGSPVDARACLETAIDSLHMIEGSVVRVTRHKVAVLETQPPDRSLLDETCDRLEGTGVRCTADRDAAYAAFLELRARYDAVTLRLAYMTRTRAVPGYVIRETRSD
jgi:hypothetical protein